MSSTTSNRHETSSSYPLTLSPVGVRCVGVTLTDCLFFILFFSLLKVFHLQNYFDITFLLLVKAFALYICSFNLFSSILQLVFLGGSFHKRYFRIFSENFVYTLILSILMFPHNIISNLISVLYNLFFSFLLRIHESTPFHML